MRDKDQAYFDTEIKRRLKGWSMRVEKATLDDVEDLEEQLVQHYKWLVAHMPCNHMSCFGHAVESFTICVQGLLSRHGQLAFAAAQQPKPEPKRRKKKKPAHPEWSIPDSPYGVQ